MGEKHSKITSLFKAVIENCTCGTCYENFARPDTIPWRKLKDRTYFNARHGSVIIPETCEFNNIKHAAGHIQISTQELAMRVKQHKLKNEQKEHDIRVAEAAVKLRQQEIITNTAQTKLDEKIAAINNMQAGNDGYLEHLETNNRLEYSQYKERSDKYNK